TNNGVTGANATRKQWLEKTALGSLVGLFAGGILDTSPTVTAFVLSIAALAHGARLVLWQPWRTLRTPLVWILHAGYAWLVVYLAMRALAKFRVVPRTLATHVLTVGAIGSLTIGMMTRTAKGHTGRPLKA